MADPLSLIPPHARGLTAIGDATTRAVLDLYTDTQRELELEKRSAPKEDYGALTSALQVTEWSDTETATLIKHFKMLLSTSVSYDLINVCRWVTAHPNDAASVIACMEVLPPAEVEIIRLLPQTGSQKRVFLATWKLTQTEIVLKQILGDTASILVRELHAHPLSTAHPNIIETHKLANEKGEIFLAEKRLPMVLNDVFTVREAVEPVRRLILHQA